MDVMSSVDALRYAVFIFDAINIGMIGGVIALHAHAFRRAARGRGLLPAHVIAVSISQIIFIMMSSASVLHQAFAHGNPWGWRSTAFFIGSTVTLISLLIIGEFERRRVR